MNRLSQLAVNREGFIFDPGTGESYSVNQTGLLVIEALTAGRAPEEIAEVLVERCEVSAEEALRDVLDFSDALRTFRLL